MTDALAPLGLTPAQHTLLVGALWIEENEKRRPSQRDLAELVHFDPVMTSEVVRTLEANELLTRETDPNDRRARQLHLTRTGKAKAKKATKAISDATTRFFSDVDKDALIESLLPLSNLRELEEEVVPEVPGVG